VTSIAVNNISVVFGKNAEAALVAADSGQGREEIAQNQQSILAVHDCSFEVKQGETLVLMGLSGSGKSTLLRTLNGLTFPSRGRIEMSHEGRKIEISSATPAQLRYLRTKIVSMVFQQFALLPWRSVADNVGFGLEIAGYKKYQRRNVIAEQLALVGLQDWSDRPVGELSGGMQQRVGLARAFATGAPILLMDEPFSALDPLIRSHLQDELLKLQQKFHKTLVFVSHDIDEAIKMGDRIALMEGGHILQCGTAQEIVAHPVNDHVAQFVRHINPLRFLTAQDVMTPLEQSEGAEFCTSHIDAQAKLRDVLSAIDDKKTRLAVVASGVVIGTVGAEEMIHHLVAHHTK